MDIEKSTRKSPEEEAWESYLRLVDRTGAFFVNPEEILLLHDFPQIISERKFLALFAQWPLWDGRKDEYLVGVSESGWGFRVKDI